MFRRRTVVTPAEAFKAQFVFLAGCWRQAMDAANPNLEASFIERIDRLLDQYLALGATT